MRMQAPYQPHFHEAGSNALFFFGTADCWALRLRILNADYGALLASPPSLLPPAPCRAPQLHSAFRFPRNIALHRARHRRLVAGRHARAAASGHRLSPPAAESPRPAGVGLNGTHFCTVDSVQLDTTFPGRATRGPGACLATGITIAPAVEQSLPVLCDALMAQAGSSAVRDLSSWRNGGVVSPRHPVCESAARGVG